MRDVAKTETSPLIKSELYRQLGLALDPHLAQGALDLDLALAGEAGPSNTSAIFVQVARLHPALAFSLASREKEKLDRVIDANARSRFYPQPAGFSDDPAMIDKLKSLGTAHIAESARRPTEIAIAAINERLMVKTKRLPAVG